MRQEKILSLFFSNILGRFDFWQMFSPDKPTFCDVIFEVGAPPEGAPIPYWIIMITYLPFLDKICLVLWIVSLVLQTES